MLTPIEQKVVTATLIKRRAWLKNSLSDTNLDKSARGEYVETLQTLDSALKKLSSINPQAAANSSSASAAKKKPPQAREAKKNTLANSRILVADDSKDALNLLNEFLMDTGFKLIELADDGVEAFEKIKSAEMPFDLILCDWDMPGLTGLEVHEKACASKTLKGAHFMMVTAVSESARIRKAIQQGINDYVVKPLDLEALDGKIKTALKLEESEESEKKSS